MLLQHHQAGTKLEKAELLEMTVAYVCRVQSDVTRQMSLGFASCMREVDTFLAQTGNGSDVDTQLRRHLVRRLSRHRRYLSFAALPSQTGSSRGGYEEERPSSSSSARKMLCFDDADEQVRPRPALRDVNDSTRLARSDICRPLSDAANMLCVRHHPATVTVDDISSTQQPSDCVDDEPVWRPW